MHISAKSVGKAIKALIKAVDSNANTLFSTLCPPNSLTDANATVHIEVKIESAEKKNR